MGTKMRNYSASHCFPQRSISFAVRKDQQSWSFTLAMNYTRQPIANIAASIQARSLTCIVITLLRAIHIIISIQSIKFTASNVACTLDDFA